LILSYVYRLHEKDLFKACQSNDFLGLMPVKGEQFLTQNYLACGQTGLNVAIVCRRRYSDVDSLYIRIIHKFLIGPVLVWNSEPLTEGSGSFLTTGTQPYQSYVINVGKVGGNSPDNNPCTKDSPSDCGGVAN
jgi:hypothetical protein